METATLAVPRFSPHNIRNFPLFSAMSISARLTLHHVTE